MQLVPMNQNQTMSSREIADLVESRHDNVKVTIRRLADSGVIQLPAMQDVKNEQGQTVQEYRIGKRDSYVIVAQLSPAFTARLVDRWQELEAKTSLAIPDFSNPALAARAWAEQYEARQLAEQSAALAIATKAEIGSRREATAMNTASQAVKQVNKLEAALDKSKEYATIKRMSMCYHGQKFDWRLLRDVSADIGKPPIDVFDANYGTVKAYHCEAWVQSYAVEVI